jgi:hypothetical protein
MKLFSLKDGGAVGFSLGDEDSPESQLIMKDIVDFFNGDMSAKEFNRLHTDPRLNALPYLNYEEEEDDELNL